MFPSPAFVKIFSVSVALVVLVILAGCITAPPGSDRTMPVTTLPATTEAPSPVPTTIPVPSSEDIQLRSNVYALSSNPQAGIDTVHFTIGLTSQAPSINLTGMKVVVSTPGSDPVILTHGTKDSTSTFSATNGNNAVTSLDPRDEVEITFRVKPITAGSKVYIEVQPATGAVLPLSRTVPAMLSSTNILQ